MPVSKLSEHHTNEKDIKISPRWVYAFYHDPKLYPFVLARYKLAANMTYNAKSVLELGCSEGLGVKLLTQSTEKYVGVDFDKDAIEVAKYNWENESRHFIVDNFLNKYYGD